jgi:hypothetical protein
MDWIDLAQDRKSCCAVVNVVTNLWVAEDAGEFVE